MSRLFEKIEIPKIDLSETEKAIKNIWAEIDRIAKDIQEQKDNAIAMEFTKCIGELLKKNGVVPKITEYTRNFETDKTFETRYGVSIDELDFSEHDKVFEDKIAKLEKELEEWKAEAREIKKNRDEQLKSFRKAVEPYVDIGHMHETISELKQCIAELESKKTVELPFDALECANYLINATYERETNGLERTFHNLPEKVNSDKYTIDDLEQIAEHLLVYCKHNKVGEE